MRIGVFDSGLGGLTVTKHLISQAPNFEVVYVGDTAYAPYGNLTTDTVVKRSLNIAKILFEQYEVDALLVACNTATAAAISALREEYSQQVVVGTEPGVKVAANLTQTGFIGVLATPMTLTTDKYKHLVNRFNLKVKVMQQACQGLVEQIERGEGNSEATKAMLLGWIKPMLEKNIDMLVLGCTHYPIIKETIQSITGPSVTLIDPSRAIVSHLLSQLLDTEKRGQGRLSIFVTGDIRSEMVHKVMKKAHIVEKITIS